MKSLILKLVTLSIAISLIIATNASAANYYNFGTLDVKPVTNENSINSDWFIKYVQPGNQVQEKIQVSNFSNQTKNLEIYVADTTKNEAKEFYADTKSGDLARWITLPAREITLEPGTSKILSVNLEIPEKAGIGLHTGGIIVKEKHPKLNIEKGIRIYLNVTGPAITNGYTQKISLQQSALNIKTVNVGTTDYKVPFEIKIENIFGKTIFSAEKISKTEPGQSGTTIIPFDKPIFGLHKVSVSNGEYTQSLGLVLFVPFWALFFLLTALLAVAYLRRPSALQINFGYIFKSPQFRKTVAYVSVFAIVGLSTIALTDYSKNLVLSKQDKLFNKLESYDLTIKWGDYRIPHLKNFPQKDWKGSIEIQNGTVSIKEYLHFEKNDKAEITNGKSAISFNLETGPDNDGIVLEVKPDGKEEPVIIYKEDNYPYEYRFPISFYIYSSGLFPNGIHSTYFKTEPGLSVKEKSAKNLQKLLKEQSATPNAKELQSELDELMAELEATKNVAQIPELENLFIEELPASPEVLSSFILDSDYVEEITDVDSTKKIKSDKILIEALKATPEILEDIVATPDLNFIFIPADTITFPPVEFSFHETQLVSKPIGTLIFIQNKEASWNTYVSTSNFKLLSGDKEIQASALTIDPGEVRTISQKDLAKKNPGIKRRFGTSQSKATLIDVDPEPQEKEEPKVFDLEGNPIIEPKPKKPGEVFIMEPVLELVIPNGTQAGTYQGELTISAL
ncbi:DUF916 domain-containing protein [Candidatus Peregrinibacteria bacterium]|nr:DUF916 domain-containing protein [Candidatus Peregrinibacteria bacterium]